MGFSEYLFILLIIVTVHIKPCKIFKKYVLFYSWYYSIFLLKMTQPFQKKSTTVEMVVYFLPHRPYRVFETFCLTPNSLDIDEVEKNIGNKGELDIFSW